MSSALSGKDRAVLVLRAIAAGGEPDPALRRIDDPVQSRAFNRYMGLIYVANTELDAICQAILFCVERLNLGDTIEMLQKASDYAAHEFGEAVDRRAARHWRGRKSVTVGTFLYGLAEEERKRNLATALSLVGHLRALDFVWQELNEEFGGESLLLPELAEKRQHTWTSLEEWVAELGGRARLPEAADAEAVEAIRSRVEDAFSRLRLVEVAR